MKTALFIILLFTCTITYGQSKWEKTGWQGGSVVDTTTTTYTLKGKDSVSFKIGMEKCNCDFYINIGDHKRMPCKNMERHYLETIYWHWDKSITMSKNKIISRVAGHWETNMSAMSMIDGTYTINNRQVYPSKIHRNNKFITINDY